MDLARLGSTMNTSVLATDCADYTEKQNCEEVEVDLSAAEQWHGGDRPCGGKCPVGRIL
jgi:hypothetical protein